MAPPVFSHGVVILCAHAMVHLFKASNVCLGPNLEERPSPLPVAIPNYLRAKFPLSNRVFLYFNALGIHYSEFLACTLSAAQFQEHSLCKAFHFCGALIGAPLGLATSLVREMVQHTSAPADFLISCLSPCLSPPLNIIFVAPGIGSLSYWEGQKDTRTTRTPHTLVDFKYLYQPSEDQIVLREIMSQVK